MCSSCKMDPSDVRIMRERQGATDPEFGFEEVNYRPKKKEPKSAGRRPGCPGNNNKAHVFVWTTEYNSKSLFFDYYGFHKHEKKMCAGCGHVDKSRRTEEYNRRNEKVYDKYAREKRNAGRYVSPIKWFSFENHDETYREKRNHYLQRFGWTRYAYGLWD